MPCPISRVLGPRRLRHPQPWRASLRPVLVVAPPPDAGFVPSLRSAVQPLIHAPQAVQPARIGRIAVIDDAILHHEGAHARPLARERSDIRACSGRDGRHRSPVALRLLARIASRRLHRWLAMKIVLDARTLLSLAERYVEV